MSRLPIKYAGKPISFRVPYTMAGELEIGPNTQGLVFPDAVFSHQVDKPFEVHRMIIRQTALATIQYDGQPGAVLQPTEPQPETMSDCIRLRVEDFSKNENMTKSVTLLNAFLTENRKTWDWEDPYTIVRSTGFRVQVDSLNFPAVCVADQAGFCAAPSKIPVESCRVEVAFQGFLIVVAAPTETR